MSAISSAVGSKFIVVSAKNKVPFLVRIIYIPTTLFTPSSFPITSNAGLTVAL